MKNPYIIFPQHSSRQNKAQNFPTRPHFKNLLTTDTKTKTTHHPGPYAEQQAKNIFVSRSSSIVFSVCSRSVPVSTPVHLRFISGLPLVGTGGGKGVFEQSN